MVALGSDKKLTTVNRLLAYREAVRLEGVAKLESGYIRIRRRTQRRPQFRREHPLIFYPRYFAHLVYGLGGAAITFVRLRHILARTLKDPARREYRDAAIMPLDADESVLLSDTRSTEYADKRRERAQQEANSIAA